MTGQRLVITSAGRVGRSIAEAVLAGGSTVHLIDRSARALQQAHDDLAVSTTVADVAQAGPCLAAFLAAETALGGIDGVVAVVEEPTGASEAVVAESAARSLNQVLDLRDAPVAAVLAEAATWAHREATERGTIMVGSTLLASPEEGATTRSYAFATLPLDAAGHACVRSRFDYGPRVLTRGRGGGRQRIAAATGGRGTGTMGRGPSQTELDWADLPSELALDVAEVTETCRWLLHGHQLTARLLREGAGDHLS